MLLSGARTRVFQPARLSPVLACHLGCSLTRCNSAVASKCLIYRRHLPQAGACACSPNSRDPRPEDASATEAALVIAVSSNGMIPWEQDEVAHLISQLKTLEGPPQTDSEQVEQIEQVEANVKNLARFLSPAELRHVLTLAPKVLAADLGAWFDFLQQFGFTDNQISYLLCQAPQALVEADLMTAGHALATMREAGLDEGTARALVVNYPQLLHSSRKEIASMVRTLSRFSTGINC